MPRVPLPPTVRPEPQPAREVAPAVPVAAPPYFRRVGASAPGKSARPDEVQAPVEAPIPAPAPELAPQAEEVPDVVEAAPEPVAEAAPERPEPAVEVAPVVEPEPEPAEAPEVEAASEPEEDPEPALAEAGAEGPEADGAAEVEAAPEEEVIELEWSPTMRKSSLVKVAEAAGLDVGKATKAQIIKMLEAL